MSFPHLNWLRELPGKPLIVAEIKTRSPYGWTAPDGLWVNEQFDICQAVGDIISVHTNELWGGSWELLKQVRGATAKPILAKGFHDTVHDVQRALDCGADHVLTIGWGGDKHCDRCWREIEGQSELEWAANPWVVYNARNPRTGEKVESYRPQSAIATLDARLQWPGATRPRLCQASHIRGPQDVVAGVDAILIGEALYTQL